jgi:hypothetical protein
MLLFGVFLPFGMFVFLEGTFFREKAPSKSENEVFFWILSYQHNMLSWSDPITEPITEVFHINQHGWTRLTSRNKP